jgi:homoserine kinase type II
MVIKKEFLKKELSQILSDYNLGEIINFKPMPGGTVQTNIFFNTVKGKFVFRYYESRSKKSVLFEINLIKYLKKKNYPCPGTIKNRYGKVVGIYCKKPYAIFEFVDGHHVETPNNNQVKLLIKKVAELQIITKNYRPFYKKHRWNYSIEFCRATALNKAKEIEKAYAEKKLKWLKKQLSELNLPKSLPKGICHCDFYFSNVLFKDNQFKALLDFDDANYTYLMFDLIGLIEFQAWPYNKPFDFRRAKDTVLMYMRYRHLNNNEKRHLFDLYKLSILIDCIWYFERGHNDFYEKRKIEYLEKVGREKFYHNIFGGI